MKKQILYLSLTLVINLNQSQNIWEKPEDFRENTLLVFQECEADSNLNVGPKGSGVLWDFLGLKKKENKIYQEEIVSLKKTPFHKEFPMANLAEKHQENEWVIFNKKDNQNYLYGFVNPAAKLKIKYTDPMLFMQRPVKFGDSLTDTFKKEFEVNQMKMIGSGTITIVADGQGTLVLPNGTFHDVVRIKITIINLDAPVQYANFPSKSTQITYVWFDKQHTSAILKIDKTISAYFKEFEVKFLLEEKTN
ncbi:MAG: hypothetical protein N3F09_07790 [Bacteroidia bacterium]|nr:hypothetical protein [Bacteroidia bacterium]